MKNSLFIKSAFILIFCAVTLTSASVFTDSVNAQNTGTVQNAIVKDENRTVSSLDVVNAPKAYLGKKIIMNARFDKFSTLGLDYKPAMRSSEEYISFLIKRDDTSHDIPLSEMKLFMKRDMAEKFIDLKTDDKIQITGTVFSDALGDAWVDTEALTVIQKAPEKEGVK